MEKLWTYQDYVGHLSHPNSLVRRWAFDALDTQYSRVYTKEVASLLGDSYEHLASAAARYLARHRAMDAAHLLLHWFLNGEGLVPGNCIKALGDMGYAEALDEVLQRFGSCRDYSTILGILHYLSKIRNEDSHRILLDLFHQFTDDGIKGPVSEHLLLHRRPGDVSTVLDYYLDEYEPEEEDGSRLGSLLQCVGARKIFNDLSEYGDLSVLESPEEAFEDLLKSNPGLVGAKGDLARISPLIHESRYPDAANLLLFAAQDTVRSRFPDHQPPDFLREVFERDRMALAILQDLSRRSPQWEDAEIDADIAEEMLSAVLACFLSVHEREALLEALVPDAHGESLLNALRLAGADFPGVLQDRIVEVAPVEALTNILTEELFTWGDIWTVQIMGRIGDKAFLPALARVLREADDFSHVYDDATLASEKLDASAHPQVLEVIGKGEVGDAYNALCLLTNLPYPEAFDLARDIREKDEEGDDEFYATCLEGIGDERGIEALREILHEDNVGQVGDSLEVLAVIHKRDIPELSEIKRNREIFEEFRRKQALELDGLALAHKEKRARGDDFTTAEVVPIRRETPKIGRNEPCPCGSGKKYKKCCLDKEG